MALDKHILGFETGGELDLMVYTFFFLISRSFIDTEVSPAAIHIHILSKSVSLPLDATLNEAAQILRLLHIEELRELQTKINEAIVAVQAIIADPKTDHRLGKVGR